MEQYTLQLFHCVFAMSEQAMPEDLVLTPGGYRPRSMVHFIENGHSLRMDGLRVLKLDPAGSLIADIGFIEPKLTLQPLMPANVAVPAAAPVPTYGSGWIAYAGWTNDTGSPVSLFRTTWTVPPVPSTQSGQTIFLFNGIQNSTMIYQPVLQWGPSAAGGGPQWSVASWYADGQNGHSFYSSLVNVSAGQTLFGIMTLTGSSAAGFDYSCEFQGIAGTTLPVSNVPELTWCNETLEAYSIQQCSDYPNCSSTSMQDIEIMCGAVTPNLVWSPQNAVTDCGQHCVVVSNSATQGQVDLYYR